MVSVNLGDKQRSIEEICAMIQTGDHLYLNGAASFPNVFIRELLNQKDRLKNIILGHPMRKEPEKMEIDYTNPKIDIFHVSDFTFDHPIREAVNRGVATYRPNHPHEAASNWPYEIDYFVSSASPMDKHGYFSLGAFGGYGVPFARSEKCKKIILEVNKQQPRVHGGVSIHISEIHSFYEVDYPLTSVSLSGNTSELDKQIASNVVELIEDGSTLQIGAGSIPDQIAKMLIDSDIKHLGVFSEGLFDSIVSLIKAGVVDNSKKSMFKNQTIFALALGSKELYDFLDDNPGLNMLPINFVNNPAVIAKNHKQVAINATMEVDLYGQCASESIGSRHYSGVGGQWEFIRGAYHSPGGKGIIVLPSTAKNGTISRIKPFLSAGTPVTISRNDVDYVVTEFGKAKLKGATLSQRAQRLISIAHPKFRDELEFYAKKHHLM